MISEIELAALKSYTDIVSLAESFGRKAEREGRLYRCCCLWHEERTPSMVLYPDQGTYHCYGCGENGDVVKMAQKMTQTDFLGALRHLARFSGYWPQGLSDSDGVVQPKVVPAAKPIPRVSEDKRINWHVVTPVPAKVPAPHLGTFERFLHSAGKSVRPVAFWEYRDGAGQLLGCDVRYEYTKVPSKGFKTDDLVQIPDGRRAICTLVSETRAETTLGLFALDQLLLVKKDVITWTWGKNIEDGSEEWRQRAWPSPSPLFGLNHLTANPDATVLLVEGCKTAAAAQKIFSDMVAMTWRGGSDGCHKAKQVDWTPLTGRKVVIWPDADEPGAKAAQAIVGHLAGIATSVSVVNVAGFPKGWDLADDTDKDVHAIMSDAKNPPPSPPKIEIQTTDSNEEIELRNEYADADRFVTDIMGKAWYCPQRSAKKADIEAGWLVWDGKRLKPSEDGSILRLAKATALNLSTEYLENAKVLGSIIQELEKAHPIDKEKIKETKQKQSRLVARADRIQTESRSLVLINLARIDQRILIDQKELDADPNILNMQNGVVHLPTGTLTTHDPKHRCTKITATHYDPSIDQSIVLRLLNRACMKQNADGVWIPDTDRIRFLQDAIGSGLYGHQELQKFYLCIGNGGDGKGTLFESLLDALGGGHDGYAMKADMQSFVRQKVSGHRIRDDLANMAGARLVLASEINKGEALDAALVKTLSGEDTQRVRHLFGKEFEFRPICTLFMQANHEPYVDSQDDAIWRRLVKIPFGPSLREDERDPSVRRALHDPKTGGAALMAWAIEGAKRTYQVKHLTTTESVEDATKKYREEMNPLTGFLIEDLRFASKDHAKETWVAQSAIVPAFQKWQTDSGLEDKKGSGLSGQRIGRQLKDFGAFPGTRKVGVKQTRIWYGVTLGPESENRYESCEGSFVPTEQEHHAQIARKGVSVIARNQAIETYDGSDAHAQKNIRPPPNNTRPQEKIPIGNFPTHAPETLHKPRLADCGNTLPDLDSFDPDF
jgi:putative DNA primase/helicase